jgi:hypothetical protein
MNDQELHAYCEQWRQWCLTRKYFLEPGAQNFLARMQPSKNAPEIDNRLSAGLSFFNMALHALANIDKDDAECFNAFYCRRAKNIKVEAARLAISRKTFYERKKRFARRALSMSISFRTMHESGLLVAQKELATVD